MAFDPDLFLPIGKTDTGVRLVLCLGCGNVTTNDISAQEQHLLIHDLVDRFTEDRKILQRHMHLPSWFAEPTPPTPIKGVPNG